MKKNTHPDYQEVVFEDSSTGETFIIGTTLKPKEKKVVNGKEYPLYKLSVSNKSHPFFTGNKQLVDAEGRIEKFKKRYAAPVAKAAPKAEEKKTVKSKKK
ncbi:MAG: type B 50S ribosomal protein L31 [Parachlamydiaceae bacterium]